MPAPRPIRALAHFGVLATCLVGAGVRAAPTRAAVAVAGVDADSPDGQRLLTAARAAAKNRPELEVLGKKRARFLFASAAPTDRAGARRAAQVQLDEALEHLRSFDVAAAKRALAAATTLLEPDLGLEAALELDRTRLALEVAVAHAARDEKTLKRALAGYAARFGHISPPRGLWPPDLEHRLATVAARARTKLRILATPPGLAWVDGRPVGATPLTVGDLPPGRHRIEVRADGHHPAFGWAKTSSTKLADVDLELAPALGHRLAKLPAKGALPDDLQQALVQACRRAPADVLVLVTPAGRGQVSVRLLEPDGDPVVQGPVIADSARTGLDQVWAARAAEVVAGGPSNLRPWIFGAAGTGVAAAAVGVGVRLWAKDTQVPLHQRQGALTQAEAFAIQDRAEGRALLGTVLIATGAALVTGATGLFAWDLLGGGK